METAAPWTGEEEAELRRGPWTEEEDAVLAGYVAAHGEGRWNEAARGAGLRRTGKSCRLRWLNYLRPGVRRGDFAPQEQLLILELHLRWGNRWSRIAQQLPGRTDNEVKNYWRTRVQKQARQLNCDVNSRHFHDVVTRLWIPRLLERIQAAASAGVAPEKMASGSDGVCHSPETTTTTTMSSTAGSSSSLSPSNSNQVVVAANSEQWGCASAGSSEDMFDGSWSELLARACDDGADSVVLPDFQVGGSSADNWWSLEDTWLHSYE